MIELRTFIHMKIGNRPLIGILVLVVKRKEMKTKAKKTLKFRNIKSNKRQKTGSGIATTRKGR